MAIVGLVLGIADNAVAGTARQKMLAKAEKLANQINKVDSLRNDLLNAYNNKDYELANNIMLASPFSGAYQTLKNERIRVKNEYEMKKKHLDDLSDEINKSRAAASAGSTASGLVDGSIAHANADKVKDDFSTEINKLVSGGATNISENTNSLGPVPDPVIKKN